MNKKFYHSVTDFTYTELQFNSAGPKQIQMLYLQYTKNKTIASP